jgi:hypothetical protein
MKDTIEKIDYYTCLRCKKNSLKNKQSCPCPRGSCEAKISGTVEITTKINTTLTPEQIKWNKQNYR